MKDPKHITTEAYRIDKNCVIEIMHGEDYKYDLFVFTKDEKALIEVYCDDWNHTWNTAKKYSAKHELEIIDRTIY